MLIGKEYITEWNRYTHKPVRPLMGSEAPCCGGELSGNFLLIIHFISQFLTTPFPIFFIFPQISNISPTKFYSSKTFQKSSKNSQIIIELKTVSELSHFFID